MLKQIFSMIFLFIISTMTFAEEFIAGKDYVVIKDPEPVSSSANTVVVTEYFSYGCPWCYRLEPELNRWVNAQGKAISYDKIPVIFNKDWEYYAKAYYTAKALDLGMQLSPVLFNAILKEKQSLNSDQAMIDFFASHGVDAKIASSAFMHSPSIDLEINDSKRQMARYQIAAVPALIVNNQYKTDLQMAKSEERLFAILDFLVNKSGKEHR
ncbi:thiol:disulfide interchange protein DsbA/DsbL [Legionella oakridgensis]|uniref:Thiol:disulfide interchange protein n=2 Tax=Legionella oakridgensis TaxID=29423 RepID=W0BBG7_9GAMM|nr:thiol:disulfide interchange protein DsbA/DsbL [Legionella oakridgensis]AHE65744.1 putative dithiol-disulfide isomerase involved in polyketide biosynthesis [Legionella oakridgensis ATCC 33761 = DSM 21215]KTD38183.1 thiol:disulfide interchange protein DsbA [Legionella oakridgensis]STY15687.1 thiol:disulfide interchange protein DsbA [Legionella longbeachae]